MIERVRECLEIDIRRVHVPVKFRARNVGDITGCHRDYFDPQLATRLRHVDRVLGKDHRIVVRKSNRPAPELFRHERDVFR